MFSGKENLKIQPDEETEMGLWRQNSDFKPSRDAGPKKDYREGCPFSILAQASLSETVRLKMSEAALDSRSTQK